MKLKMVLITALLVIPCIGMADTIKSSFSISHLYGNDYQLGASERKVISLEYASLESWGDQFFFLDRTYSPSDNPTTYFEWSPRFKITDFSKKSFFKNISIATTMEAGANFNNYLIGVGTNLSVAGFNYIGLNFYRAENDLRDDDYQMTLTWGYPFSISKMEFLVDGFIDYSSASNTGGTELLVHPQLKWDLSKLVGLNKSKLYVGLEYDYWRNKYGIKGVNEHNPNFLIKFHY